MDSSERAIRNSLPAYEAHANRFASQFPRVPRAEPTVQSKWIMVWALVVIVIVLLYLFK